MVSEGLVKWFYNLIFQSCNQRPFLPVASWLYVWDGRKVFQIIYGAIFLVFSVYFTVANRRPQQTETNPGQFSHIFRIDPFKNIVIAKNVVYMVRDSTIISVIISLNWIQQIVSAEKSISNVFFFFWFFVLTFTILVCDLADWMNVRSERKNVESQSLFLVHISCT